jgi:hypothetical protein
MIKVKISTNGLGKPFIKQLPDFKPIWGNCEFFINEDIEECDFWIIYGGLLKKEKVKTSKKNIIFITNEPPSIKKYSKKFTDQFGTIITCHKIRHPNVYHFEQALPWWVGHKFKDDNSDDIKYDKTYDELKKIKIVKKEKLISVIISNKSITIGHRKRINFVKRLKEEFGDNIDIFGYDYKRLEDKWDAIYPYKYHIVLENSSLNDYWTEKLSDAFLGESYPVYYGCKNIFKYFSKKSLTTININMPNTAIKTIKKIINENTYDKFTENIQRSKILILDKYQLFPMIHDYINNNINNKLKEKEMIEIFPEEESLFIKTKKQIWKIITFLQK